MLVTTISVRDAFSALAGVTKPATAKENNSARDMIVFFMKSSFICYLNANYSLSMKSKPKSKKISYVRGPLNARAITGG